MKKAVAPTVSPPLLLHGMDLQKDGDEHGKIQHEHKAEINHHGNVEDCVILNPTATKDEKQETYKTEIQKPLSNFAFKIPNKLDAGPYSGHLSDILNPLPNSQELTNNGQFKYVVGNISIEDLDESIVHVDGFQAHPSEGRQQEVMEKSTNCNAEATAVE
ncbi:UNVERIFIED_CONTAM: hypothetical protein K2H54_034390 [Gekko kuhli]